MNHSELYKVVRPLQNVSLRQLTAKHLKQRINSMVPLRPFISLLLSVFILETSVSAEPVNVFERAACSADNCVNLYTLSCLHTLN
jgi:hypothetical protein